jgi:diguanylate cyclase (GGDEF)-like protein
LKALSTVDGLTGIANRRHFDEALDREWRRGIREEFALSLLLIDIDFFKGYNDHYGHQSGDDCLRRVAQTLAETFKRPSDLVARYGGEEFVVIASATDATGAAFMAERLRSRIEEMCIPHAASTYGSCVTVSIGVATIVPTFENSMETLIASADEALYQAKREGRNCLRAAMLNEAVLI